MCAPEGQSRLPHPSLCPSRPSSRQGGSPRRRLTCMGPSPPDASQGRQPCADGFSPPSYPVIWRSFLQLWLCKRSSASFQLVFYVNFSACRCIFDVFVWNVNSTSSYSAILILLHFLVIFELLNQYIFLQKR